MSKFDSHFIFHADGGPFPGTCIRCGAISKLWNIGMIPASNMTALVCNTCLTELAVFAGFVTGESYASLNASKDSVIEKYKAEISAAPKLMEKFSNDVNNLISEFVTGLASVAPASKPVQPKGNQANVGKPAEEPGASYPGRGDKIRATKSGAEPTVE